MQIDLTDKRVLVTGSSRGIGNGIAQMFLDAGARVAVNGSSDQSTRHAVAAFDAGDRVVSAPGSVAEVEGCRAIVEAATAGLGGLDILVNNAGWGDSSVFGETSEELWDRTINTNLKGVFFTTQFAAPALRQAKGAIVNFSSVFALVGSPGASVYGAAKAGVINLTKTMALELAPDVRVNAVCPGGVDTDMLRELAVAMSGSVEAGYAVLAQDATAMKRIAHIRELAGPVLYLCSDLASFVTGSVHVVDGGETID
ncbi:MAG: SDR family NAD(P)-dependent oxidoreductase [Alphaproteobacteria bacterium]|jgi:NAD(P)-dependent dehydrogenase (short-subunit alcohol dehydrogenase family)|nr:SDR family oxidoreductase [Rhodospirillaceae bacterium]MBT7612552.1 SDR family oxidoreductase [Rhodospirillaceae bacterium]MDG2480029.1 SDR family NAD(P)-dependent oxidoreductase [Alphaproteobacteria bacterium]